MTNNDISGYSLKMAFIPGGYLGDMAIYFWFLIYFFVIQINTVRIAMMKGYYKNRNRNIGEFWTNEELELIWLGFFQASSTVEVSCCSSRMVRYFES